MPHSPGLGAIYGIVAENGVPVENSPVHLLDRTGPRFVRTAATAADGGFAFSGLNTETDDYMVLATDETFGGGDPAKNALIQDRVTPVSVHVGTYYPSAWWSKLGSMVPAIVFGAPWVDTRYNYINLLSAGNAHGIATPKEGGTMAYGEASPFTNGAFNLPVVELLDSTWIHLYGQSNHIFSGTSSVFSIVVVADFSQPWGITQRCIGAHGSSNQFYVTRFPFAFLAFDGTKLRFQLAELNTVNDTNSWTDSWDRGQISTTYDHTPGVTPTGFTMVAVSFKGGSICNMYIDGTEVLLDNTTVPTTFNARWTVDSFFGDAALHGYSRVAAVTGPKFAFYMATSKFLSTAELDGLKDALWNGGFPTETGYARAVTVDLPAYYFRMDEVNSLSGAISEHYEGDDSTYAVGDFYNKGSRELVLTPGGLGARTYESGPTAGRSACVFDGTWVAHSDLVGVLPSYRNFSLAFWLKHTTRSGTQYLFQTADNKDSTATKHFAIYITDTGELNLRLEGPDIDLACSQILAVDTWYCIHIVINISAEKVSFYVNGDFENEHTVLTTPVDIYYGPKDGYDTAESDFDYHRAAFRAGGVYDGTSVSNGFLGALAEFTAFSYPLSAARIAAHYADKDII